MKKIFLMIAALGMVAFAKESPVDFEALPAKAKQMIAQNFANEKVVLVKKDADFLSHDYEVIFESGMQIEFEQNGEWNEVKCRGCQVPKAMIPQEIQNKIDALYQNVFVVKIEKEKNRYEVNLSNQVELKFNGKMKLIDID